MMAKPEITATLVEPLTPKPPRAMRRWLGQPPSWTVFDLDGRLEIYGRTILGMPPNGLV